MPEERYTLSQAREALGLKSSQRTQIYYHAEKLKIDFSGYGRKKPVFSREALLKIAGSMRANPKSILRVSNEDIRRVLDEISESQKAPIVEEVKFELSKLFNEHLREIREKGLRAALKDQGTVDALRKEFRNAHHSQWIMLSKAASDAGLKISTLSNQIRKLGMHPEYQIIDGSQFAHFDPYYKLSEFEIRKLGVKVRFQKGRSYVHKSIVDKINAVKEFEESREGKELKKQQAQEWSKKIVRARVSKPRGRVEKPRVVPVVEANVEEPMPAKQTRAFGISDVGQRPILEVLDAVALRIEQDYPEHDSLFKPGFLKFKRAKGSEYSDFMKTALGVLRNQNISDDVRAGFLAKFSKAYRNSALDETEALLELSKTDLANASESHFQKAEEVLDGILKNPRQIKPLYASLVSVFPKKP